jgi:hypothetical protein
LFALLILVECLTITVYLFVLLILEQTNKQ